MVVTPDNYQLQHTPPQVGRTEPAHHSVGRCGVSSGFPRSLPIVARQLGVCAGSGVLI